MNYTHNSIKFSTLRKVQVTVISSNNPLLQGTCINMKSKITKITGHTAFESKKLRKHVTMQVMGINRLVIV
jgi:hypothetical protein